MILRDLANNRNNNFDFLRFFAAALILYGHCYPLLGVEINETVKNLVNMCAALPIFFIISGFLITKSWNDNPNFFIYIKKRLLRIYPALICMFLFVIFIVGPLACIYDFKDYFIEHKAYKYLIQNISLTSIKDNLPGVFLNNPMKGPVNGSLWTLPVEFFMYLMVALFGITKLFKKKHFFPILLCLFFLLHCYVYPLSDNQTKFLWLTGSRFVELGLFFFIGSAFYFYRDKIKFSLNIFLLFLFLYIAGFSTNYGTLISFLTFPYIVLYIAYIHTPILNKWGKYGDFSYGIYIYAFPIQQLLVYYFKDYLNIPIFFISSFMLTLFVSAISWHIVEKNALKLKNIEFRSSIKEYFLKTYNFLFSNKSKV